MWPFFYLLSYLYDSHLVSGYPRLSRAALQWHLPTRITFTQWRQELPCSNTCPSELTFTHRSHSYVSRDTWTCSVRELGIDPIYHGNSGPCLSFTLVYLCVCVMSWTANGSWMETTWSSSSLSASSSHWPWWNTWVWHTPSIIGHPWFLCTVIISREFNTTFTTLYESPV